MNFTRALDKKNITGFSMGIYGAGGVGKTSFIKMLPPENTLYIAIDDSSHPIMERNFYFVRLPKPTKGSINIMINELNDIYRELKTNAKNNILYVVIDSITEMERYFQIESVLKRNAKKTNVSEADSVPTQKDYGDASILTSQYLMNFRDLKNPYNNASKKAINTFFIANEMSEETIRNEETVQKKIMPFLTKKMSNKFRDAVDILGYIYTRGNGERVIRLSPSESIEAKNRYSSLKLSAIPNNFNIVSEIIEPIKKEITDLFSKNQ